MEEAEASGLSPSATQELLARQAQAFDRLVSTVTEEHAQHLSGRGGRQKTRRLRLVERMLSGNRVESAALEYDLERQHLGVITSGANPATTLQALGSALDRQLLLVRIDEHETWAWLSGREETRQEELARAIAHVWPADCPLALGEQGFGFMGWRMTHRQAVRSWHWASSSPKSLVRYRDMAISSAMLRDEELVGYLRQYYLTPLTRQGTRGPSLPEALRAYFEAEGNVSSAASRLRISRQALRHRLQLAERCLGMPIEKCRVEIECALRLEEDQERLW